MNANQTIRTLKKWHALLASFNDVVIDITGEQTVVDAELKERQQIIDSLQHLDGELTEIRARKAAGWPDFDAETVKKIELLIEKGNAITNTCIANDQKNVDIAANLRREISANIGNVRKSKGYLMSSHVAKQRPSIIVDSHA
ncbi:MAG: hypothetical protein JXX29_08430 [Deltaproteobacteria bacterium]|nr:hypothetical protein [Deltaproteobacteria bacterium]MBN2671687.1 hypothetical protein [Deltaproteobacteria bacterium]